MRSPSSLEFMLMIPISYEHNNVDERAVLLGIGFP